MNRLWSLQLVVMVMVMVAGGQSASAQPCVDCWDKSCLQMRSYGLPECKKSGGVSHGGAHEEVPRECTEGRVASAETQGHCCFAGQVWSDGRCRGLPTSCPETFLVDVHGETCRPPACTNGEVRTKDGAHCCWAGQVWGAQRQSCVGVPSSCPRGFKLDAPAERCALLPCADDQIRAPDGVACARCKGEFMIPNHDANECVLRCSGVVVPNADRTRCEFCPEGMAPDAANEKCVLLPCENRMVRAPDGVLCRLCEPGTEPDEKRVRCVVLPCKAGTARMSTSAVCAACKSGFEPAANRESCVKLPCPVGQMRSDNGACEVDPVWAKAQADARDAELERKRVAKEIEDRRIAHEKAEHDRIVEEDRLREEAKVERAARAKEASRASRFRAGIALLVVGVVLGGGAGALGGVGVADAGSISNSSPGDFMTESDLQGALDKSRDLVGASIFLGVLGGLAAVTGAALTIAGLKRGDAQPSPPTAAPTANRAHEMSSSSLPLIPLPAQIQ